MWLAIPVVILVVLAIVGGALVAGIYAAILLPIVVLILIGAGVAVAKHQADPEFRARRKKREKMPLGGDTGPDLLPGGRTVVQADEIRHEQDAADEQPLAARQRAYRKRQPDR